MKKKKIQKNKDFPGNLIKVNFLEQEIKYAKNHCTKREKVQKLRELISDSIDQEQKNKRLLRDNDLVVLGKPRDALHTIEKNQQRIKNLG